MCRSQAYYTKFQGQIYNIILSNNIIFFFFIRFLFHRCVENGFALRSIYFNVYTNETCLHLKLILWVGYDVETYSNVCIGIERDCGWERCYEHMQRYMEQSTIGQCRDGRNTSYNRFVDGNIACANITLWLLRRDVIVFFCERFSYCNTIQSYVYTCKLETRIISHYIIFFVNIE